ncbi:sensor histidine kinase [Parapedobacter sp. DT-150]|uniref:sensor histidine kinase n=1 Tax=Parapedobacter sp. DT-150 TaxID=3396162 RepID=UPI003F1DF500
MQHNLRLILLLIVAAGIGIIVVLGSWLYGSYHQRMELFVSTAERTLFDAIQATIQQQENAGTLALHKKHRGTPDARYARWGGRFPYSKKLVAKITERYPTIAADSLALLLDSLALQEGKRFIAHRSNVLATQAAATPGTEMRIALTLGPRARPQQLLPNFLFGQAPFDSTAFAAIEDAFKTGLEGNGIHTDFTFELITAKRSEERRNDPSDSTLTLLRLEPPLLDSAMSAGLSIRPILIDPENGRFITVTFNSPWQYLLYNLSWQLTISVALVATIIGCFVYLFHTIFKQNKLALLRKAFVNNMTHELRTPVATVSAAVQALQSYAGMEDEGRRDLYLSISKEELDHLSAMIDNVLLVAEGEHHTIKQLQYQHYNMISLVKKCIAKAKINKWSRRVDFIFNPIHTVEMMYGDAEHMRNVMTNLLDNAAKYGATEVSVTMQSSKAGRYVELHVRDNGIGIPHAYQQQVFEPFVRVPQGDTYQAKGFGLGLSYVKQVVAQHGGEVRLKSAPGEGSTFILVLPKNATP